MTGDIIQRTEVDKGWAWVVMFATFGCHVIIGGLQHTGGLVRYALQENIHKENLHYIPWLGSIYSGLISFTGPLSSLMVYKFGCRATILIGTTLETLGFLCSYFVRQEKLLFLTYSLMAGSGSGLTYSAVMIVIGYNFEKYLALAAGVSVSGQGIGLLVVALLLNFCFENYGLKGSFLIMASLTLQKWVLGSLLRPSNIEMIQTDRFWHKKSPLSYLNEDMELEIPKGTPSVILKKALSALSLNSHQSSQTEYEIKEVKSHLTNPDITKDETSQPSLLKNFQFLNFLFCLLCASTAEGMVYLMVPSYFISNGASPNQASEILSLIGVCSTVTRPLMGFLANSNSADVFLLFLVPYGILGVFTLFLPFYVHFLAGKIIFGIIFGLYNCSVYALLNKITLRIAGMENMATAFGLEMFIWGTTGILGTPLADSIVTWTGSFGSAFVFAGSMYVICAITALLLPIYHQGEVTMNSEPVKA